MPKSLVPALIAAGLAAISGQAMAGEHVVRMIDSGPEGAMIFHPAVVYARPGDTVRYVPTNPGHNAELISGMLPAGVAVRRGPVGREFVLRVTAPGIYGVKCAPHYSAGMVGLVQVGPGAPNLDTALAVSRRAPNFARRRFAQYFTRLH